MVLANQMQEFKSNLSLEQANEIVYFLHVDTRNYILIEKYWGS